MSYKLSIALVPSPLWGVNLRWLMTKTEWTRLRRGLLGERGLRCETCGKTETESRRIFAHEEWRYDEATAPPSATLTGIVLSCWHCHACEHFGRTCQLAVQLPRAVEDTIAHFCVVNGVGRSDFDKHEREAFALWRERSHLTWRVDCAATRRRSGRL